MASHARYAPSATEREFTCPASHALNVGSSPNTVDSANGTAAHFIGELCLTHDHDVDRYSGCSIAVGPTGDSRFVHERAPAHDDEMVFEVNDEMITAVQSYIDWCRETPGDHFVEVRVDHTPWCPQIPKLDEWGDPTGEIEQQKGTSDHVACAPGVLTVTDLKYGKGVKVFAEANKQAIKYALGTWLEYDWIYGFKKIVIRICQPRINHFDTWELTVEELLEWGEKIRERLELTLLPDPPFGPSEKGCRFCKVSATCRAQAEYIANTRAFSFDDESAPALLTAEELVEAWRMRKQVESRLNAIADELLRRWREGETLPGVKVVQGVTHRRWRDQEAAAAKLESLLPTAKLYKKTLISPNQAEELLAKDKRGEITDLWDKPPGGPSLVDDSDSRDGVVQKGFDDET